MTASVVKQWFDVDNHDDVRDALVADIVHKMQMITIETPAQEAEDNEVEVNELTASPPSLAQLYAMFHPIQESAFLCNLPDAGSHLQRALHVFREAIRKSNTAARRQMLITELLPKRTQVFILIKFCQHWLVRIRNSAEIAASYEGSTMSLPPVLHWPFTFQVITQKNYNSIQFFTDSGFRVKLSSFLPAF